MNGTGPAAYDSLGFLSRLSPLVLADRTHRLLLVDDHPVVRAGLAELIENESDLAVFTEASGVEEALTELDERRDELDLVLLDLSLPDGSGLELLKDIRSRGWSVPILAVSRHDELLYAIRCLRAGAQGYVAKDRDPSDLVDAVRRVLDGDIVVSDEIRDRLLRQVTSSPASAEGNPLEGLSDRELEVFEFLGRGLATAEIADRLSLSPKTVHTYRQRIKDKLGLERQGELIRHAVKWIEDA